MGFTNFRFFMEFEIVRLANGIRVIYCQDKTMQTVHCGFTINAGSRDELSAEHGLTHWIEHCIFKGTAKRKSFHILNRLDSVGGEVNAFTTKEETCIYTASMKQQFDRAAELIFDIVFSPSFPEKEILKEKSVIVDEINSYKDNPDEMLMDDFEELLFPNDALGRNILGTKKSIMAMNRGSILTYTNELYKTDRIVFACVGNVSRKKLDRFINTKLATVRASYGSPRVRKYPNISSFQQNKKENVHQVHALIGGATVGLNDERRRVMVLLNNMLGGPALNSILNLKIREKLGYCYFIESSYHPYSDVGLFQIYFGTDPKYFSKTTAKVEQEMQILATTALSNRRIVQAKKQLIGQLALSNENRSNHMLSLAKTLVHFDKVDTFSEMKLQINEITGEQIRCMAEEVFRKPNISSLAYVPK